MLGNPTTTTTSTSGGIPIPSTDPNPNPSPGPFSNGPSVYLYGFLATLVLIFLVSIGVAWKGYRTRRVLRARIEEAIARGVLIPGYDPSNPNLPLLSPTRSRNSQVLVRPVLYEEWIGEKLGKKTTLGDVEGGDGDGRWDMKPTAVDVLRPYDPNPLTPTQHPSSHANPFLNQLLDPLRQYWFVQAPEGADAGQLQGRPRRGARGRMETLNRLEEEQLEKKKMEESMGLLGVREVVASVLIAMPDRGHPAWEMRAKGIASGDPSASAIALWSRPRSWQQAVASGSRPTGSNASAHAHAHTTSISTTAVSEGERKEELPELVLGVVLLGLREETRAEAVVKVEEREAETASSPAGNGGNGMVVEGNGGSERGNEQAATTRL